MSASLNFAVFMRLPKKYHSFFIFSLLLLQGCMSPQRDMARFSIPRSDEEPAYKEKAEQFIRYAQAGDIDKMISITSNLSFATESNSLHTVYAQQVVPQFTGTVVTWDSHGQGNIDEYNNAGLVFTGTAHGEKTHAFDIVVMKENGKLVITNIKRLR